MPVYIYRCPDCGSEAEVWKKHSEIERSESCESCGSHMERQLTSTSFALRGTGWHVTDYRSPSRVPPDGK